MYDLDIDAPEKFPVVLESVAEHYRHARMFARQNFQTDLGNIFAEISGVFL